MKAAEYIKLMVVWITILISIAIPTHAQQGQVLQEDSVKAALLIKLVEFISWPEEQAFDSYTIGMIGASDGFADGVTRLAARARIKEKPVRTVQLQAGRFQKDAASKVQVLYVGASALGSLTSLATAARRTGTLIVTDSSDDTLNYMINLYRNEANQVRFIINPTNLVHEYLSFDRNLLLLGGSELDVAEVYKSMGDQLERMKTELEENRAKLTRQTDMVEIMVKDREAAKGEILALTARRQQLDARVAQQAAELENSRKEIAALEQKIQSGVSTLDQQASAIAERDKKLKALQTALQETDTELEALSSSYDQVSNQLKQQEGEKQKNAQRIEEQVRILQEQEETLLTQETLITSQKNYLIIEAILLVLLSGFVIYTLILTRRLRIAKAELEDRVEKRTADLEEATRQAIAANEAKSEFLANMSHELRTPLNAIIGFAEMINYGLTDQSKGRTVKDYSELILQSGRHLLHIINDILDLSRIEAKKIEVEIKPLKPIDIITPCFEMMGASPVIEQHQLVHKVDDDVDVIYADEGYLRQILLNLLSNACKFSPPSSKITVRVSREGNGTILSVSDTGVGIPDDKLEEVLKPFVQVDLSYSKKYGGVGLGLALVKNLVDAHGGKIRITSEAGTGTTVSLFFPDQEC